MNNKTPYPSDAADKFMLRFPEGLRERIKALAEENGRSMNAEIVRRLENSLLNREPSSLDQISLEFDKQLIVKSLFLEDKDRETIVKAYLDAKEAEIKRIRDFINLGNEVLSRAKKKRLGGSGADDRES